MMSLIKFKNKKEIATWVSKNSLVAESRKAAEESDGPGAFEEVEEELVKLIAAGDNSPDFGEDWSEWLNENIDELLREAIAIVT